jgi:uncharacterized membrane protein YdjX (TVP38/TMEM64 family)
MTITTLFDNQPATTSKENRTIRWTKLVLTVVVFIGISVGFGFLIQWLFSRLEVPLLDVPLWMALLFIFFILLAVNLSLFIPLPFGISIMLVAASHWNPALVALVGALGASLGEFSGYFAGYLGKKIAINEKTPTYKTVRRWVQKYGMWAIAFVSLQPVIPFEIGGFIAGVTRMPIRQFLPAVWIGKFLKYLFIVYIGASIFNFLFSQ